MKEFTHEYEQLDPRILFESGSSKNNKNYESWYENWYIAWAKMSRKVENRSPKCIFYVRSNAFLLSAALPH